METNNLGTHPFNSILRENEKVLWTGKPEGLPYATNELVSFFKSVVWAAVVWAIFIVISKVAEAEISWGMMHLIAAIIIVPALITFLKKLIEFKNIHYCVTDNRILIQTGVFNTTIKSIESEKINFTNINSNFLDKIFNVGTLLFYSGEVKNNDDKVEKVFDKFESIQEPFRILNFISLIVNL